MQHYRLVIFDLDGTLYRGNEVIPFAAEAVNRLKNQGIFTCYLTNNSSQTREFFLSKLKKMGFPVDPEEIYSSGIGSAAQLKETGQKSAFAVGMPGLVSTLEEFGVEVVNRDSNGHVSPEGAQADAVVVGICQEFTYDLMSAAMQQILAGAKFIATNRDSTFPLEKGRLTPGAGSIVSAIETCSGVPPFVVGKPNPYLLELVMKDKGCSAAETLAVGDRMDTDIESGRRAGCDTLLVLTGVETSAPPGQRWGEDLRVLESVVKVEVR